MNEKVSVSKPMHAILELYLLFIGQENNDFIFLCTMLYDSFFFFIVTETLKTTVFFYGHKYFTNFFFLVFPVMLQVVIWLVSCYV